MMVPMTFGGAFFAIAFPNFKIAIKIAELNEFRFGKKKMKCDCGVRCLSLLTTQINRYNELNTIIT